MTLPRVAVLVLGHRDPGMRAATLASFREHAEDYRLALVEEVDDRAGGHGFCGAIQTGWARLRANERARFEYVFHLEEDWSFERRFSIAHMARLLDVEPRIAQVALRRGREPGEAQPVVEAFPDEFEDRVVGMLGLGQPTRSQEWLEHRLFFTTNPCLYRRSLLDFEWPDPPRCEAAFTDFLAAQGASFAYWGDRHDEPWIRHVGHDRAGGHSY